MQKGKEYNMEGNQMKVFVTKDKSVFQLADKESIKQWNPEMPLIFIGYIRDTRLEDYPKDIQNDVEEYLEEILEDIAIPKLIEALKSDDVERKLKVAKNLKEISSNDPDQLKIALPHIKDAVDDPNKEISKLMKSILKDYERKQKRKRTAKKRAKLRKLRNEMDEVDMAFANGEISDDEYLKKQKDYLRLKREIQEEEA